MALQGCAADREAQDTITAGRGRLSRAGSPVTLEVPHPGCRDNALAALSAIPPRAF